MLNKNQINFQWKSNLNFEKKRTFILKMHEQNRLNSFFKMTNNIRLA